MKKTLLVLTLVAACFTLGACASSKSKSCCPAQGGKSGKADACCAKK